MEAVEGRSILHEQNLVNDDLNSVADKCHCVVVPAWEREFTLKIGGLEWESFDKAKKHIYNNSKVMKWNDSASEEAFNAAKTRFWYEYFYGLKSDEPVPYVEDENWILITNDECCLPNGGRKNRILNLILRPVAKIKRYTGKKLLPRTTVFSTSS